jgi:O-antigen/teichoic acid export membrane protein
MILRYSLLQLFGRVVPGLLGFVLATLLTRLLSPAEYGAYGLAVAIAQFVFIAVFGWLGLAVTRFLTANPAGASLVAPTLALFALMAGLALVGAGIAAWFAPGYGLLIGAGVLGGVMLAYFDIKCSFFSAAFRFEALLWLSLTRAKAGFIIAMVVAWFAGSGLLVFLGSCAGIVVVSPFFRSATRADRYTPAPDKIRALVRFGAPLALSLALFSISQWVDRVIVQAEAGGIALGYYSAAAVVVQNTVLMLGTAIGSACLPLAVRAHEVGGYAAARAQLAQNLLVLLACLVPAAVGLAATAPNFAATLIGPDFREAVTTLTPILAASALLNSIRANFVDHAFHVSRATRQFFWIALVAAIVNLAALFLLVPRYGIVGAAIAGLITASTALLHAAIAAQREYALPLPTRDIAKIGIAILAMLCALAVTGSYRGGVALAVQIVSAALVYGVTLLALNLGNVRRTVFGALTAR